MEARVGIEPTMQLLQSRALPLGYPAAVTTEMRPVEIQTRILMDSSRSSSAALDHPHKVLDFLLVIRRLLILAEVKLLPSKEHWSAHLCLVGMTFPRPSRRIDPTFEHPCHHRKDRPPALQHYCGTRPRHACSQGQRALAYQVVCDEADRWVGLFL